MNRFLLACVGAFAAATAVCGGCDDAGGGPAPEIARRALEPDVRAGSQDTKDEPLVPLVVTFAGGIEYSDPSVDRDWELVALDGGATDLVDDAPTWHLSPLSRYRLTVGGGQYDPISIEMLTGEVRSTASREPIHMTQGLRLSHQGEAFVSALDHTRAQRIIGRPIQDPAAVQWEYAAVRVDPAAPTGLSTTRITTRRFKAGSRSLPPTYNGAVSPNPIACRRWVSMLKRRTRYCLTVWARISDKRRLYTSLPRLSVWPSSTNRLPIRAGLISACPN